MFGTFLLFILYVVSSLGVLVGVGAAVFFLLKAKQELTQPREMMDILKDPMLFFSEQGFSKEGNLYRIRFLQISSISLGLIILIIILKLVLS